MKLGIQALARHNTETFFDEENYPQFEEGIEQSSLYYETKVRIAN